MSKAQRKQLQKKRQFQREMHIKRMETQARAEAMRLLKPKPIALAVNKAIADTRRERCK